ncbi:unnamed protein product [Prunus armeniaca]|uniref:Uncharacterized protein n=1 Tax=Prunus armeniaca TaxID=36596 RepID=A0A6J5WYM7_PRUAR|nr:hypothetical protein GBA52_011410 [Prunus armeniaca]CAB4304822.1 unnamed protein product [Prunus armeniaca]
MRWKSKAWAVLGTVAAVEELKEKNLSKWRSLRSYQHALINNIMPLSTQVGKSSSSTSSTMESKKKYCKQRTLNLKQSEEPLRLIMYLSCWGPN